MYCEYFSCPSFLVYLPPPHSAVGVCVSALSICGELLEIWGGYELIRSRNYDLFSCATRLLLKTVYFSVLVLFYTWSWERPSDVVTVFGAAVSFLDLYAIVAGLFAVPYVCAAACHVFPSLAIRARASRFRAWQWLRHFWWPSTRIYVAKNMLVTERLSWRYTLFWVTLLALKFWCSYTFQVQPLVAPTLELLFDEPLRSDPLFPGFNLVLVALLWLPFVFVYLLDAQIWYAVWTAVVGAVAGMAARLGEVADFATLRCGAACIADQIHCRVFLICFARPKVKVVFLSTPELGFSVLYVTGIRMDKRALPASASA
jgi:hypothetical protein